MALQVKAFQSYCKDSWSNPVVARSDLNEAPGDF